jgi:hypothetical protein
MSRIAVATLVAAIAAIALDASDASAMSNYRWKYRPLLVFADGTASAALAQQRTIVAASRTGLAERKIVVVWVIGDAVNSELGPAPAQSAGALRARFGASTTSFRAVLVGKDGGAKMSQSTPLDAARLFATIDAMPMRRDEMRLR